MNPFYRNALEEPGKPQVYGFVRKLRKPPDQNLSKLVGQTEKMICL